eukprot:1056285-Pyramimonas_sp.AAC.1
MELMFGRSARSSEGSRSGGSWTWWGPTSPWSREDSGRSSVLLTMDTSWTARSATGARRRTRP